MGLLAGLAALTGCGSDPPAVTLRVTHDFGRKVVFEERLRMTGVRTPAQLLRAADRAGVEAGRGTAWALSINGIEVGGAARRLRLTDGDTVQLDLRRGRPSLDVSATTVGAFPAPFANGLFGANVTTDVRCSRGYGAACQEVREALEDAGVDVSPKSQDELVDPLLGGRPRLQSAIVLVGPWSAWAGEEALASMVSGPGRSGVFARFAPDDSTLRLLDWRGRVARPVGAGAGLVAALRPTRTYVVWLVSGVDREGVEHAARTLDPELLRGAYAVAVSPTGVTKLPLPPRPRPAGHPWPPLVSDGFRGALLLRGVDPARPDADGRLYELASAGDALPVSRVTCGRFHAVPAGPALCLRRRAGDGHEAVALDRRLQPRARRRVAGRPDLVRVSPDGRYGAFSTVARGARTRTATRIVDMRDLSVLAELEELRVSRGGRRVSRPGSRVWGVTFGRKGLFYATYEPDSTNRRLLIEGRVGSARATVVAAGVEMPALSPDGTRIAYQRRLDETPRWRLRVRDLITGDDWPLAERRSIRDQPEWLGPRRIGYSDGRSVRVVWTDGSHGSRLAADQAASPAWLPQLRFRRRAG